MWFVVLALYFCANGLVHYRATRRSEEEIDWDVNLMMMFFGLPLFFVAMALKRLNKI